VKIKGVKIGTTGWMMRRKSIERLTKFGGITAEAEEKL